MILSFSEMNVEEANKTKTTHADKLKVYERKLSHLQEKATT